MKKVNRRLTKEELKMAAIMIRAMQFAEVHRKLSLLAGVPLEPIHNKRGRK